MSDEQTQQLLYRTQVLEGYFSELTQKESSIISIIREATSSIECLKSINDKDDNETLMPVGLGTFVKTKITPNKKLILNIGAGVAVEKDKNSAINFLESRLKEMQIALQETAGQKQQVTESLQQAKLEMEKLMTAHNQK